MLLNEAKTPREREMLIEAHTNLWTAEIVSNGMINEIAPLIAGLGRAAATAGQAVVRGGAQAAKAVGQAAGQAAKGAGKMAQKGAQQAGKVAKQGAKKAQGAAKQMGKNVKKNVEKKLKDKVKEKGMELLQQQEEQGQVPEEESAPEQSAAEQSATKASVSPAQGKEAEAAALADSVSWMTDAESNISKAVEGLKGLNGAADSLQTNVEQCFSSIGNDDMKGIMTAGAESALSNLQQAYESQLNSVIKDLTTTADKAGLGMDEAQIKSAAVVSMAAALAKLTKEIAKA